MTATATNDEISKAQRRRTYILAQWAARTCRHARNHTAHQHRPTEHKTISVSFASLDCTTIRLSLSLPLHSLSAAVDHCEHFRDTLAAHSPSSGTHRPCVAHALLAHAHHASSAFMSSQNAVRPPLFLLVLPPLIAAYSCRFGESSSLSAMARLFLPAHQLLR